MKTEHAAVKKLRILQEIAGAEQADIAELGLQMKMAGTIRNLASYASERDRQCIIFCCGTAGLGSNLLCDSTTWTAIRSFVEENGERPYDSRGAVGVEIALRKALWRKHHDGDNT
ncbi:hypothetical protein C8J57DRAFT_1232503 [Mycena rebaudengoi]|nr:hypothetical protein C8J57DRAFT_1232503 [Mycena rebaudengoi]